MDIKKILFATDFSRYSEYALTFANVIAKSLKAQIHIVHVVSETVNRNKYYLPHSEYERLKQESTDKARTLLEETIQKIGLPHEEVKISIIQGTPSEKIIQLANELAVDLIVLGTHGRAGLNHLLYGSTAENVLLHSRIPVMVIHKKWSEECQTYP